MDKIDAALLIKARIKSNRPFDVTVQGISMNPALYEGDVVSIQRQNTYQTGDVLAFKYKNEGFLIHRLLRISDGRFYCKGDNAFRIEDVTINQVLGKAISVNDGLTVSPYGWRLTLLCRLSLRINKAFIKAGRQTEPVKKTGVYMLYKLLFLNGIPHEH